MIEHLVLSGAATNGLIQVGLLNHLIDTEFFNMSNIKSIYATSAGALISILIVIGVSIKEIKEYLIHRPWEKLFTMDLIFHEKGIFTSKQIYEIIKPFMCAYDIPETYTLLDLYNRSGIDLHIFTTKINGMKITDLNHITHPTLTLKQASMMTASIPVVFPPIKYENEYYIDGAILNRCPLQSIQPHNYDPTTILIIDIVDINVTYTDESTILDFISILFANSIYIISSDKYNEMCSSTYKYYYRITSENIFNSNAWDDFVSNIEYRQTLYDKGYDHLKKIETKLETLKD